MFFRLFRKQTLATLGVIGGLTLPAVSQADWFDDFRKSASDEELYALLYAGAASPGVLSANLTTRTGISNRLASSPVMVGLTTLVFILTNWSSICFYLSAPVPSAGFFKL